MEPSRQNNKDSFFEPHDVDAFISYDQHSLSDPLLLDRIFRKTFASNEDQLKQKSMDVANASDKNVPCNLDSQFQTDIDRRPDESDPQKNHNEFSENQFPKTSEPCNNDTYFDDETYCFPYQNESSSENEDSPSADSHSPPPNSSGLLDRHGHELNRVPKQPLVPAPIIPVVDGHGLGVSEFQGGAFKGISSNENQTLMAQQEYVQPRQSLKYIPPLREERADSVESDESLSRASPSKRLKVESPQTHSTACSTTDNPSSTGPLEGSPQAKIEDDELNDGGTSTQSRSEEEHRQGVNEAAIDPRRRRGRRTTTTRTPSPTTTKTGFKPHKTAFRTICNSILQFLGKNTAFRKVILAEVCEKYKISLQTIKTYIEQKVKSRVNNHTQLWKAIGNRRPVEPNPELLPEEQIKEATWLVFQIFLGTGGHYESWVDDSTDGYEPGSRTAKGTKKDIKSQEYLAKQEEKRRISKREGEREKLRKIFEDASKSACPNKGRKKDNSVKKTGPIREEEFKSFDELFGVWPRTINSN